MLFGPPIATGIGVLIGWLLTLVTSFDAWRAMLLGVILVAAFTYFLLRISGELLDIMGPDLEEEDDNDEENDEDMYIASTLFDDVTWMDTKGRTRRVTRVKRKGKKS